MSCRCDLPRPKTDPRFPDTCRACGYPIPEEWGSASISRFLDRLEATYPVLPDRFQRFRIECESRELAGRTKFGTLSHHGKNNIREAIEEAADGFNYCAFEHIVHMRQEGRDDDVDLVLVAARHFADACEALHRLKERRAGGS